MFLSQVQVNRVYNLSEQGGGTIRVQKKNILKMAWNVQKCNKKYFQVRGPKVQGGPKKITTFTKRRLHLLANPTTHCKSRTLFLVHPVGQKVGARS